MLFIRSPEFFDPGPSDQNGRDQEQVYQADDEDEYPEWDQFDKI